MDLGKQYQWLRLAPAEIQSAVRDYTGELYRRVNGSLIGVEIPAGRKEIPPGRISKIISNLDRAFLEVPEIEEPITVYRGIKGDFRPLATYLSTSTDLQEALSFSGTSCCLLIITVVPGSKVLPLEEFSDSPSEKEILLPRNGTLTVNSERELFYDQRWLKALYATYQPPESYVLEDIQRMPLEDERSIESREHIQSTVPDLHFSDLSEKEWMERIISQINILDLELLGPEETVDSILGEIQKYEEIPNMGELRKRVLEYIG